MAALTENECCGEAQCVTSYHLIGLVHSVLTIAILNWADIFANVVTYSRSRSQQQPADMAFMVVWAFGES